MLHRDGPETEESSPSPLTPGGPPLEMGREVRATKGRPEEARMDREQSYNPIVLMKVENRRAPARGGHGIHWREGGSQVDASGEGTIAETQSSVPMSP